MTTAAVVSAQVDAKIAEVRRLIEATYQRAVDLTVEEMQRPVSEGGNMPTDTGFLRASMVAQLGDKLTVTMQDLPEWARRRKAKGDEKPALIFAFNGEPVNLVIKRAGLEPIVVGWSARYARHVQYKTRFRDLAIQRWPQFVDQAAREVAAEVGMRG